MSRPKRHESDADYWRNEVDRAIHYHESASVSRSVVLRFNCTPADLSFAMYSQGLFHYRGWMLDIAPTKPKQPRMRDLQTDIEGKL